MKRKEDENIVLERPDEFWMRGQQREDRVGLQEMRDGGGIARHLGVVRVRLDVGALGVHPQDDGPRGVTQEGKGINAAVEWAVAVNFAMVRSWVEIGADAALAMRLKFDLSAVRGVKERSRIRAQVGDFFRREEGGEEARRLRKAAAHVAGQAERGGHDLF